MHFILVEKPSFSIYKNALQVKFLFQKFIKHCDKLMSHIWFLSYMLLLVWIQSEGNSNITKEFHEVIKIPHLRSRQWNDMKTLRPRYFYRRYQDPDLIPITISSATFMKLPRLSRWEYGLQWNCSWFYSTKF